MDILSYFTYFSSDKSKITIADYKTLAVPMIEDNVSQFYTITQDDVLLKDADSTLDENDELTIPDNSPVLVADEGIKKLFFDNTLTVNTKINNESLSFSDYSSIPDSMLSYYVNMYKTSKEIYDNEDGSYLSTIVKSYYLCEDLEDNDSGVSYNLYDTNYKNNIINYDDIMCDTVIQTDDYYELSNDKNIINRKILSAPYRSLKMSYHNEHDTMSHNDIIMNLNEGIEEILLNKFNNSYTYLY